MLTNGPKDVVLRAQRTYNLLERLCSAQPPIVVLADPVNLLLVDPPLSIYLKKRSVRVLEDLPDYLHFSVLSSLVLEKKQRKLSDHDFYSSTEQRVQSEALRKVERYAPLQMIDQTPHDRLPYKRSDFPSRLRRASISSAQSTTGSLKINRPSSYPNTLQFSTAQIQQNQLNLPGIGTQDRKLQDVCCLSFQEYLEAVKEILYQVRHKVFGYFSRDQAYLAVLRFIENILRFSYIPSSILRKYKIDEVLQSALTLLVEIDEEQNPIFQRLYTNVRKAVSKLTIIQLRLVSSLLTQSLNLEMTEICKKAYLFPSPDPSDTFTFYEEEISEASLCNFLMLNFNRDNLHHKKTLSEFELIHSDLLIHKLCYKQCEGMSPIRMKVCRKMKTLLQSSFDFKDAEVSSLVVELEAEIHRAYFYSVSLYKRAVIWYFKRIAVERRLT